MYSAAGHFFDIESSQCDPNAIDIRVRKYTSATTSVWATPDTRNILLCGKDEPQTQIVAQVKS
jgi:hypothetical protein